MEKGLDTFCVVSECGREKGIKKSHLPSRKLNGAVHIWSVFKSFVSKGRYICFGRDAFKKVRPPSMVVLDNLEIVIEIRISYHLILISVVTVWEEVYAPLSEIIEF